MQEHKLETVDLSPFHSLKQEQDAEVMSMQPQYHFSAISDSSGGIKKRTLQTFEDEVYSELDDKELGVPDDKIEAQKDKLLFQEKCKRYIVGACVVAFMIVILFISISGKKRNEDDNTMLLTLIPLIPTTTKEWLKQTLDRGWMRDYTDEEWDKQRPTKVAHELERFLLTYHDQPCISAHDLNAPYHHITVRSKHDPYMFTHYIGHEIAIDLEQAEWKSVKECSTYCNWKHNNSYTSNPTLEPHFVAPLVPLRAKSPKHCNGEWLNVTRSMTGIHLTYFDLQHVWHKELSNTRSLSLCAQHYHQIYQHLWSCKKDSRFTPL